MGFTVSQVIRGYGDICQVVTELADETDALITADEFHTFNRCLDDAIAHAVSAYERRRDESATHEGTERLGVLAHELRNRLGAAMLSFNILQEGTVGIGGSTGAILGRSLRGMHDLINNALAGVRLESGIGQRHRVALSEIIGDAEVEAAMSTETDGIALTVSPVPRGVDVAVDQQILAAAIGNLLQNAFKFSHAKGPCHAANDSDRRPRPDRDRGRVRRPPAGQGRRFLPPLLAGKRQANRPWPRAHHQPQGRRGHGRLARCAQSARQRVHLLHRAAEATSGMRLPAVNTRSTAKSS